MFVKVPRVHRAGIEPWSSQRSKIRNQPGCRRHATFQLILVGYPLIDSCAFSPGSPRKHVSRGASLRRILRPVVLTIHSIPNSSSAGRHHAARHAESVHLLARYSPVLAFASLLFV